MNPFFDTKGTKTGKNVPLTDRFTIFEFISTGNTMKRFISIIICAAMALCAGAQGVRETICLDSSGQFHIPAEDQQKHIWLQIDGIFPYTSISVNGFDLGHEPSGYATHIYNISEYLNYGGDNQVCIKTAAAQENETAEISSHIRLTKASKVHVAPFGTFVYSRFTLNSNDSGGCAACIGKPQLEIAYLTVETIVENMGTRSADYSLKHRLIDAAGTTVAEKAVSIRQLHAKASGRTEAQMEVWKPHLWTCEDPYLYTVVTEVICDGEVVDTYETETGIRHIAFDADSGLYLNGKDVKLKGMSIVPDEIQEQKIVQMKKIGCNALRVSHNAMAPHFLEICDSLGMLVIEENRLTGINREHVELFERMIKSDRNHPSVVLWSAGNDEWGTEWNEHGKRIAESMREYCSRFDPTRQMTTAQIVGSTDVADHNDIEKSWKFIAERAYLAGVFYRAVPGFEIFDASGLPKDEAYYLKSWWATEPVLHIVPRQNDEGVTESVWVYSNCEEIQLIADGVKLGRKVMPLNGHLEWEGVCAPKNVKAVGYRGGKKIILQTLR